MISAGVAHEPADTPAGVVVLTHGAGGSRESPLLVALCEQWARRGWLAIRYDLPFRQRRPSGPPSGSAEADMAGLREVIAAAAAMSSGPLIAGGHSYGGRLTSMVAAAEHRSIARRITALTLFSYPLHPPGRPERLRTEHFPAITVPTVFTHGGRDPFGGIDELRDAAALIPATTEIVEIDGARHDLVSTVLDVPALAVAAALRRCAGDGFG
ncbi:MAG: alpha/beta family hydrolase [Mycobacteriaceae bacterium]